MNEETLGEDITYALSMVTENTEYTRYTLRTEQARTSKCPCKMQNVEEKRGMGDFIAKKTP